MIKDYIVVEINKEDIKKYNDILSKEEIDFEKEKIKEDSILFEKNIFLKENNHVCIRVCTGQNNAYVDAILFNDGDEIESIAGESLDGEYDFSEHNNVYIIVKGI